MPLADFLKGAESYRDLDTDPDTDSLFDTADEYKECIKRVLGLEIER